MGFILMYDITNEESFNAVQDWYVSLEKGQFVKSEDLPMHRRNESVIEYSQYSKYSS